MTMNVLIVDDSAMMRSLIRRVLEDNQAADVLHIIDAENGEVAWRLLQENKIKLIFLDWNMPVLDGLAFVKRVRAHGLEVPVIMVSAVTEEDKIYDAGAAGVTAYLEKPVRGAELWDTVRDYLK
jgi:two-component system, chemotaxis family, chemotaxis protein CheY